VTPMPEAQPDVDEAAVRDALEDAYRRKADSSTNKYELFGYASDLPDAAGDELALQVAGKVIRDPPEPAPEDLETPEPASSEWAKADFSTTTPGVYPTEHQKHDAWMVHRGDKRPYAPWGSGDDPAPCSTHHTTADECDCDARKKWGYAPNRNAFEKAKLSLDDSRFEGLTYIQTENDPFVFVDGDDVRDPESGDVHPAFRAILNHLGITYADVSTSGTGAHAYYRGTLPGDETTATWDIDDAPFGQNDDPPTVEIYSGKHVCVATGDHVDETPTEVRRWNGEVLRPLLEANDELDDAPQISRGPTPSGSSPSSTASGDRGGVIDELNRLDAAEVAEKTIVDEWTSGGGAGQTFLPTWGNSNDGGTANFVDETCWVDTGQNGGRGGPVEMALIDLGELSNQNSEVGCATGGEFWKGYEHLRDLGFDLPELPSTDGSGKSGYYDADLGAYVDGDPWSDPDAMLTACLMARAEGAVSRDADPPTLALTPIVREYLGVDEVGEQTRDMAAEVFHDDLSAAKNVTDKELNL